MKSFYVSIFLLFGLIACDNPQQTRRGIYDSNLTDQNSLISGQNPSTWNTQTTSGTGSGNTTGTTGGSGNSNPPGFENCDITPKHYSSATGQIGVCQSEQDEKVVAVKVMTPPVNQNNQPVRLCLIPTYRDGGGNSTYLGQPQCFYPNAEQVTQGNLVKNRNGYFGNGVPFSQLTLNGVMIMREGSLDAYFGCMNAYVNFIEHPQCSYGAQTSPACAQKASAYMNQICNDFKVMHSYLDLPI